MNECYDASRFNDEERELFLEKLLNKKQKSCVKYLDCTLQMVLNDPSLLDDFSLLLQQVACQLRVQPEQVLLMLNYCVYEVCFHEKKNELKMKIFGNCDFVSTISFLTDIVLYIYENYSFQKTLRLHK